MALIPHALAAWLHYAAIIGLAALVAAELALYRREMTAAEARRLARVDALAGLSFLVILLSGLARVFWYAKGWSFYLANPLFWVKMLLVVGVVAMSIRPTVHFIRRARALAAGSAPAVEDAYYRRIRRILWGEVALLILIPLLAALMARGVGM